MIHIHAAVPPSGRAVGSLVDCKIEGPRHSCRDDCMCVWSKRCTCVAACKYVETRSSTHFKHEYTEYRCLELCRVNKHLYQEVSLVFFTQNTFEFHNTMDLKSFLNTSTKSHAEQVQKISLMVHGGHYRLGASGTHSSGRRTLDVPSLVEALDELAKCTGLETLQAGFQYSWNQELVEHEHEKWAVYNDRYCLPDLRKELEKLNKNKTNAIWQWNMDFSTTSAVLPTQAASTMYKTNHNALAALHDKRWEIMRHDPNLVQDEFIDFAEDAIFCARQILLLHRCFRMYNTWQRSPDCPWVEWPRYVMPPASVLNLDMECADVAGCRHERLCMDPKWTPPERDWWAGFQRNMLRRDKSRYWIPNEVESKERIMLGTAILQENHRNGH
jgi:hypothetical protein